jgi:hypothetical protein
LECFSCFRRILQVFLSACCIYCSSYIQMLQTYVSNVSPVSDICCSKCFILQVFSLAGVGSGCMRSISSRCLICCNSYTGMLQVYVWNVSAVSDVYCKCFYLHAAYIAVAIYKMLQTYVSNVSPVSDICCSKCFILQVFSLAGVGSGCKVQIG